MGQMRAELLTRLPEVDDVVVGARDGASAEALSDRLRGRVVPLADALSCRCDAVVVCVPTTSHSAVLRSALAMGVPVFCEKPLTDDLGASEALAGEFERAGRVLQMGYHRRFDPGFSAVRAAVGAGDVGTLYSITITALDHRLQGPGFLTNSGGIFRDLHVHDFDLARWVTGLEIEQVCAAASVRADPRLSEVGDFDTTAITAVLSGGVLLSVSGARHNPRGQDVRLEVHGSKDDVCAGLTSRLPLRPLDIGETLCGVDPYEDFMERFAPAFAAETAAFVDVVCGRRANPCPPEEDLAAFGVAVAADRSVRSGRVEPIHPIRRSAPDPLTVHVPERKDQ